MKTKAIVVAFIVSIYFLFTGCNKRSHVIYAIKPNGNLEWYKHLGYKNGNDKWANDGKFIQVGEDWTTTIRYAFRANSNIIYGIKPNGDLGIYRHFGWQNGVVAWDYESHFRKIAEGWDDVKYAFSGGGEIIYVVKQNGDLGWYKHTGQEDGSDNWANNGTFKKIASGWQNYVAVFSTGNGIIYGIKQNGDVEWYKHLGYLDGSDNWVNNGSFKKVAENWNNILQAFSGGDKIIYVLKTNGDLGWYKHIGQQEGTNNWANNGDFKKIASSWNFYNVF